MTVSPGRPSVDERFALGLCARCSKDPEQPGGIDSSKVQQLVRSNDFDPNVLKEQRRRRRERRIIRNPHEGEHEERARILERYRAEARDRGMPA